MDVGQTEYVNNLKSSSTVSPETIKATTSKSILSYQNGSTSRSDNLENDNERNHIYDNVDDISPKESSEEEERVRREEMLDVFRKKRISDLIVDVFNNDLEKELVNVELMTVPKETQALIQRLVVQITQLTDTERLLLYLKLPSTSKSPFDPLRQPLNPLGNRQEIQQTIVWIKTHLEEDQDISIPKQDVYDQYLKFCMNASMKPLSTADFGKVMKQVYPGVRPRRLGTRGNSRYCYSGMRNTCKLPAPVLPSLLTTGEEDGKTTSNSSLLKPGLNKKIEKSKRKWKSSTRGKLNYNSSTIIKKSDALKMNKRSKIESNQKLVEAIEKSVEQAEESRDEKNAINFPGTDIVKNENSCGSFNAFESLDNDLGSEFTDGLGIYFDNIEKIEDNFTVSLDNDQNYQQEDKISKLDGSVDDDNSPMSLGDGESETDYLKTSLNMDHHDDSMKSLSNCGESRVINLFNANKVGRNPPPTLLPLKWSSGPTKKLLPKLTTNTETTIGVNNKKMRVETPNTKCENSKQQNNKDMLSDDVKLNKCNTKYKASDLTNFIMSKEEDEIVSVNKKSGTKVQRRHSFSKGVKLDKNMPFKKTYVRIQPKPELPMSRINLDIKFNVKQQLNVCRTPVDNVDSAARPKHQQTVVSQDSMDSYLHGDESNSQEQEEEIVRYFQHLDQTALADGHNSTFNYVDKSALITKNNFINSRVLKEPFLSNTNLNLSSANLNDKNELLSNGPVTLYSRSQSCVEMPNSIMPTQFLETVDQSVNPTVRSQSSLDFSANKVQPNRDFSFKSANNCSDSLSTFQNSQVFQSLENNSEKISQLRLLLEKSIPTSESGSLGYSMIKQEPVNKLDLLNTSEELNVPTATQHSLHIKLEGDNSKGFTNSNLTSLSQSKFTDESVTRFASKSDFVHRIENMKPHPNCAPLQIPQSPNTRTKYFSFTPISPGPHSPLKTPSTPSASPFVSPRNTPIPRSRQNSAHSATTPLSLHSNHDHFIYPTDRNCSKTFSNCCSKVQDYRPYTTEDGSKMDVRNDEINNPMCQTQKGDSDPLWNNNDARSLRPRSYSTTNFEKTEARKNLLKMISHNISKRSNDSVNHHKLQNNCSNTKLGVQSGMNGTLSAIMINNHNLTQSNDPLANEISNFFQNTTNHVQLQNNSFRSHSAPLRRITRNNSWIANQLSSPIYNQYMNINTMCQNSLNPTPVPSEFCDFVTNTCDIVLECQNDSLSQMYSQSEDVSDVNGQSLNTKLFTDQVSDFNSAVVNGVSDFNEDEMKEISEVISKETQDMDTGLSDSLFTDNNSFVDKTNSLNVENVTFTNDNNSELTYNNDAQNDSLFSNKIDLETTNSFQNDSCPFQERPDNMISENIKSFLPSFENSPEKLDNQKQELFKRDVYVDVSENKKDPIITSFKPVLLSESYPNSPVSTLFGAKLNEDNNSSDFLKSASDDIIQTENILNHSDVFVGDNGTHHFTDSLSNGFIVSAKGFD